MLFFANSPADRYTAAHEHFGSAGFDTSKMILVGVAGVIVLLLVLYAMKK